MKKTGNIVWGVILIIVGVIFALNALEITDVSIFFEGWWTLFIIVPCLVGIIKREQIFGNIIGIAIGVVLLLCARDIISYDLLWKLLVPAVIVIIGIKLIASSLFNNQLKNKIPDYDKGKQSVGFAAFSGTDMNFDGQVFEGAELNAIFGGVKCDLRNARIEKDCVINVSAIFGGIDILAPEKVNIKVNSTSLFGGISNKTKNGNDNAVTLYISGTCLFGGVDIK